MNNMYGMKDKIDNLDLPKRHIQNPRPLPLPLPLPRGPPRSPAPRPLPLPRASSFFLLLGLGASSTKSVSRGKASGNTKYRMLLPRIDSESRDVGSRLRAVILTVFK